MLTFYLAFEEYAEDTTGRMHLDLESAIAQLADSDADCAWVERLTTELEPLQLAVAIFNQQPFSDTCEIVHEQPTGAVKYFWAHEYRHTMRDCPPRGRAAVYQALVDSGLSLSGESWEHARVIKRTLDRMYPLEDHQP